MKEVSTEMSGHLQRAVTTLCTCWKIVRTDGETYRFTDADVDVTVGGDTYLSYGAYERTAIDSSATLAVSTLDVTGLSGIPLPETELRSGRFDNAHVYVFATSWAKPVYGEVRLLSGFFGEVVTATNGTYTVELRSLSQKLAHDYTKVYTLTCQHDLGNTACGVDLSPTLSTTTTPIPVPIEDAAFEDIGSGGGGETLAWYDPDQTGGQFTVSSPTFSGTYAARGVAGGRLVQDIPLGALGKDFIDSVDAGDVTVTLNAYRRDAGGRGKLRTRFLAHPIVSLPDRAPRRIYSPAELQLNGSGIIMSDAAEFAADFTLETWVKLPANNPGGTNWCLFDHTESAAEGYGYGCRLYWDSYHLAQNYVLFIRPTESSFDDYININFHMEDIAAGEWAHIAVVRNGTNVKVFCNFKEVVDVSTVNTAPPFRVKSFGCAGSNGRRSTMSMAEIRMWDHAKDISALRETAYEDMRDGTPGLGVYYPMIGGTTSSLYDRGYFAMGGVSTPTASAFVVSGDAPIRVGIRDHSGNVVDGDAFDEVLSYDENPAFYVDTGGVYDTGFQDVGDQWVKVTITTTVPRFSRLMRLIWQTSDEVGDDPALSFLDSVWGTFHVVGQTSAMPVLNGGTGLTRGGVVISGDARTIQMSVDNADAVSGWYNGGLVTFYSGDNAGFSMEVKEWTQASGGEGTAELYLSLPYPVKSGDIFTIYPGCDKTRVCCAAMFDNVINFFGMPDVPGEDELLKYPDAK